MRGQLFWLRRSNCQIFGIFEDFWSFLSFLTLFGNGQIYLTYLLKNPNFLAQAYSRHMKLCLGANISIANAWFFCARSISVFGFFSDFFFLIFFEFLYLKSAKMDCLCLLKVYQGTLDIYQPCYQLSRPPRPQKKVVIRPKSILLYCNFSNNYHSQLSQVYPWFQSN